MNHIDEFIDHIEKNFDVKKIKLKKENIWVILRISYFFCYVQKQIKNSSKSEKYFFNHFRSIFYGFSNYFKSYSYLIFTDSSNKIKINGKFFDKSVDELNKNLGLSKTLVLETPNRFHKRKKLLHNKNISSLMPVILFTKIIFLILKFVRVEIRGKSIIDSINQKFDNIKISPENEIRNYKARYWVYKQLLRIYSPKVIFFDTFVGRIALVKAANDLNIKTYEIQHGFVSGNDIIYHSNLELDKSFYPSYFLSFGRLQKEIFDTNKCIIDKKNIIPVGKFFLENDDMSILNNISEIKSKFYPLIGFTLQKIFTEKTFDFFEYVLKKNSNAAFFLIVKNSTNYHEKFFSLAKMHKNFFINYKNYSFDQIIKFLDIHSSATSTCCIEAPFYGTPNILIDFDGSTTKHMGFLNEMTSSTQIAINKNHYINKIKEYTKMSKIENILDDKNLIIEPNYPKNIRELTLNL